MSGGFFQRDAAFFHVSPELLTRHEIASEHRVKPSAYFRHVVRVADEFENLEVPQEILSLGRTPAFHFFKNFSDAQDGKMPVFLDSINLQNPDVPPCVIGAERDVESADANEFDRAVFAKGAPGVAWLPRVFGDPFKSRDKSGELRVFARTERGDRRLIQRVSVSRHLRRLRASRSEHRLDLLVREAASPIDSAREFFEKFRIVETAEVFEVASDSLPVLTRELGQFVDDRVESHAARMPATRAFAKPF